MNIAQILRDRATASGDQAAILDVHRGEVRRLTFRELESAAAAAAGNLRQAGLRPGDAVLVLVPMSAELYITLCALFRLGLTAQFLDPSAGRQHIEACCALCDPRAFIGSSRAQWLRFISPALRRIPLKFSTGRPVFGARPLIQPKANGFAGADLMETCLPTTPALIRFTSGSTGEPKAAVRSHGFLLEQQRVIERSLQLAAGEVDLSTLPIFVLANLASGVTSILPDGDLRAPAKIRPEPVIRQIDNHRPNRVSASPAFLKQLAGHCAQTGESLDTLERVFTGGAPVFPHLLDRFQTLAPKADIVAVYGSTEAEPIAKISRREISQADRDQMAEGRGLLAGYPDPAIRICLVQEGANPGTTSLSPSEFAAAQTPPGQPGQIVVSGPHVQPGYLNGVGDAETKWNIEGTAWHRTGDSGQLDSQGRLWLLGRSSERIQDARGTLYPFQVECAAHQHSGVERSALIAHRGERWLVVEVQAGQPRPNLIAALAWAALDRIHYVRRIPVDSRHNAKVDYPALRKMLD